MKIDVQSRSGKCIVIGGIEISDKASVSDLQQALYKAKNISKLHPSRQRLTVPGAPGSKPVALTSGKQLSDYGLVDGGVVIYKDLGLQIGYSTVFFWEYFGPLVVYAVFYFFPALCYGHLKHSHQSTMQQLMPGARLFPEKDIVQTLALAYWTFHYSKRILETFLVHKFSHATMPIANLFKNCSYYWAFAAYVSYFINHPLYTPPPATRAYVAFAIAMLCQATNFRCHLIQAGLRQSGSTGYSIPRGFLFEYVTCANYCAEIYGWVAFAVATQTAAAGIFILCGGAQMAVWAASKHARLKKLFDGKDGKEKYPKRWVMLPPFF